MAQMKLKYPIQSRCKAGYFDALAQTGTRNTHRFDGIGILGAREVFDDDPVAVLGVDEVVDCLDVLAV